MIFAEMPRVLYMIILLRFITGFGLLRDTVADREVVLRGINILTMSQILTSIVTLTIIFAAGKETVSMIPDIFASFTFLMLTLWWRYDIKTWVEVRKQRGKAQEEKPK